jgi:thiosulfate/3-mercaptopyruvate sulfurtransferase
MNSPESHPPLLVYPSWISAHLHDPDLRLVEVDVSPAAYGQGHIPGAILWNAYADLRDASYLPVERSELERLLSRSGITPDMTLVFYGYGAALGFWLMKAHGHADVRMLDGSREQWPQSGAAWSTDVIEPTTSTYKLPREPADIFASRKMVEAAIEDPGKILLDVRAEQEYSGEQFWPSGAVEDAGRPGHLPHAISVPIDLLRSADGALKNTEELQGILDSAGVSKDKVVIAYCTIGNRASQAWFALKYLLDYPEAQVYYGSWVEWGKLPDTPIELSTSLRESAW